ncbi:uncharacterized protein LOC142542016 [Primulina tabacum]|uniref:uncharacterized protein LOC142542016 n=1 Tax=Primulina tabacum TaxID=48773 RepID=UPI003F599839
MAQANLPIFFWRDALLTAAYILNKVPSKSVTSTPYELWTGRKPDLSNLIPWGSAAYIYDSTKDGSITEIESRNVKVLENDFPKKGEIKGNESLIELSNSDNELLPNESSKAQVDELLFDSNWRNPDNNDSFDQSGINSNGNNHDHNGSCDPSGSDPDHFDSSDPQLRKSNRKVEEEMDSMKSNQVWELVELPKARKAIGNKWVLKIKRKPDGTIERYKARLVAKCYT